MQNEKNREEGSEPGKKRSDKGRMVTEEIEKKKCRLRGRGERR